MWSIIWSAITGNLAGIVTAATGIIGKLSDNETVKLTSTLGVSKEVAIAQMQAAAGAAHDRAGMQVTQWLIALALIPPLTHQGAIYLDSIPFFFHTVGSWGIPKAPPPYDDREWSMICSLLGIQAGLTTFMSFARILLRR